MAKFNVYVNGFFNDFGHDDLFQPEKIRVTYSADPIGKTLSIGSEKHNIQMTIPFDAILEMINNK